MAGASALPLCSRHKSSRILKLSPIPLCAVCFKLSQMGYSAGRRDPHSCLRRCGFRLMIGVVCVGAATSIRGRSAA
jgi:hypothetical protein